MYIQYSIPKEFYSYNASEAESEPNLAKQGSGYAVVKRMGIHTSSGTMIYIDRLAKTLKKRGIIICIRN